MLILALDSCGASCAVGVWRDGQSLYEIHEEMQRGQDARLLPMVVQAMQNAQIEFADLDRIVVTRGPGSFTGARVGLAAAIGLGLACGKPVIGIDRFAAYQALHASRGKDVLVVIESKRADLFCRFFPAHADAEMPRLMDQPQIDLFAVDHPGLIIAGDRKDYERDMLAQCAALGLTADANDPNYSPTPLYLRAPDVTLNSR